MLMLKRLYIYFELFCRLGSGVICYVNVNGLQRVNTISKELKFLIASGVKVYVISNNEFDDLRHDARYARNHYINTILECVDDVIKYHIRYKHGTMFKSIKLYDYIKHKLDKHSAVSMTKRIIVLKYDRGVSSHYKLLLCDVVHASKKTVDELLEAYKHEHMFDKFTLERHLVKFKLEMIKNKPLICISLRLD